MSHVPTFESKKEPNGNTSMGSAFNNDGCCTKHPDVLLRQKSLFGRWKILLPECPRCGEEWRATREASQSRVQASDATIRQLKEEETNNAAEYEKQMKNVLSDKDAQIKVLLNRVHELQQENASLLNEVDRLRQEIDVSTHANAETVQALLDAKTQLLNESDAVVGEHFSDLSSQMQRISLGLERLQIQAQSPPPPPPPAALPKADGSPNSVPTTSGALLPADIRQCHADLAAAREELVHIIDRSQQAQTLVLEEETTVRRDLSKELSTSEVDARMDQSGHEIENAKSVSNEPMNKFEDALLNSGAESVGAMMVKQKRRIKDLQKQLYCLHKQYSFAFASADDVFSRSQWNLCHLREIGFTADDAKDAGFALNDVRQAGYPLHEAKGAGYTLSEARSVGYTLKEATEAGYTLSDARFCGYTLKEVMEAGAAVKEAVEAGYTLSEVRSIGYTLQEAKEAGFTLSEARVNGYMVNEASKAGFTLSEVLEAGFVVFDNDTLKTAVGEWVADQSATETRYGHISTWCVSYVTSMKDLFKEMKDFNEDISTWDVSNVKDMAVMFYMASSFNQPLLQWDVSNVTNMGCMFYGTSSFNQSVAQWDVMQVTNMSGMFHMARLFNQPLAQWSVSQVTDMSNMFGGASSFNQPLSSWDVSHVTNMVSMFNAASSFNQPLSSWDVSRVTDMSYMFYGASSFNQPMLKWNVRHGTNMSRMFLRAGCTPQL